MISRRSIIDVRLALLLQRPHSQFHSHIDFFFTDPPPTEIYTLSLHDALPICSSSTGRPAPCTHEPRSCSKPSRRKWSRAASRRSEEHTSELQSRRDLVCRLLLEKNKSR